MRKILAGFMATSMIVAVASSVTFAANASASFDVAIASAGGNISEPTGTGSLFPLGSGAGAYTLVNSWSATVAYTNARFTLPSGDTFDVPINASATLPGSETATPGNSIAADYDAITLSANPAILNTIVNELDGQTFSVLSNNYRYTGKITRTGPLTFSVQFDQKTSVNVAGTTVTFTGSVSNYTMGSYSDGTTTTLDRLNSGSPAPALTLPITATISNPNNGSGTPITDTEASGSFITSNCTVADVIFTDGNGDPIVFTENRANVDEDQNATDGVQTGKTVYFLIRDDDNAPLDKLEDDTYWKMKVTKGDNGKYIKAVSDVSKTFSNGLYALGESTQDPRTVGRHRYIKVELAELYTDDEYKLSLDMRLSAKSKAVDTGIATDDSEFKVKDFYFYMKNLVKDADNDWKVGITGLMLNPLENDWNDVTWYDEDGDLAHMKFFADSDVDKFYSKLSTKWEHADYASYFNDQDAFIFNFTGSPKLSSTSRADLEIYNPFIDEDGNETIDPSTAVVYQVIDGDLYDVTDSFEYKEGENGDMAFCTRTRFLGTYIICEKAVEEAVADETVPEELTPDTTAPEEVTPDTTNNGKQPANTGKYL